MPYRMLATDLDGTLFSSKGSVSTKNRDAIHRATQQGIPIVLCSGRAPQEGVAALGKDLGLDYPGNHYICCSGSIVVEADTLTVVVGNYLSVEAAAQLIRHAETFPEALQPDFIRLCTTEAVYENPYKEGRLLLPSDLTELKGDITKLLFFAYRDRYPFDFVQRMEPLCPPEAVGYIMPPPLAEYVGSNAGKGRAVAQLADRLGLSMKEVICVGDGYNDICMLEDAGLGIAVANAAEPVKEKADLVLDATNDEDAIQKIIDTFLL